MPALCECGDTHEGDWMSVLPPNWLSSTIGANAAAHQSADTKRTEAAAQQRRITPTPNQAIPEVEDIEIVSADEKISADAEGAGSQGRAFSQGDEEPSPSSPKESGDAGGDSHIDLRA